MRGDTYTGHLDLYPIGAGSASRLPQLANFTFGAYGDPTKPRPVIVNDSPHVTISAYTGQQLSIRDLHIVNSALTPVATGIIIDGTVGANIVNTEIEGFTGADAITADNSTNLTIQNSVFYNNGHGFGGGGVNLTLLDNTFFDNGTDTQFGHNAYLRNVTNALVQGNLFSGGAAEGLVIHQASDGITIRGNEFTGNSNGLQIIGSGDSNNTGRYYEVFNNVLIEDNIFDNNGLTHGQGYGLLLASLTNSVIRNNIVYGNRLGALTFSDALAGDQQSNNVLFDNNLFSGVTKISGSNTTNLALKNNIFTSTGSTSDSYALIVASTFPDSQLALDYNQYFMPNKANGKIVYYHNIANTLANLSTAFHQEAHGINANPLFVNAGGGNFMLLPGSPAIDKGITIPGLTDDLAGNARPQGAPVDIGPYEFSSAVSGVPTITALSVGQRHFQQRPAHQRQHLGHYRSGSSQHHGQDFDGATVLGVVTTTGLGAWNYTTAALPDGAHTLIIKAVDQAGNVGAASAPLNVVIDTVAPAAPSIAGFSTDSGVAGDRITSDNTLTLSGSVEANSILAIYDGAILLDAALANGNGSWSYTSAALADGVHNLTVTATDAAANTSAPSATFSVAIDTAPPAAPVIASLSTNRAIIAASGSAEANSTVRLYDGATLLGAVTASGIGAWSYTSAALVDGVHNLTATATDAAQQHQRGVCGPFRHHRYCTTRDAGHCDALDQQSHPRRERLRRSQQHGQTLRWCDVAWRCHGQQPRRLELYFGGARRRCS